MADGDTAQVGAVSTSAAPAAPVTSPVTQGLPSDASASTAPPAEAPKSFGDRMRIAAKDQSGVDPTKPNTGPIPFDRHETILTNARKEAADKAVAEYKATYGWAEKVPQDAIERYAQLDQQMADDPVQLAYDIMQAASKNPKFAAKIKSLAARTLSGRPAAEPTATAVAEMPGPDTDSGYSQKGLQALLAWQRTETLREAREGFQKELDPFRTVAETFENQRKSAEREQYLETRTQALSSQIDKLPLAKEHEDAIAKAFLALPAKTEADLVANMYQAYHSVVGPVLEGKSQQAAMKALSTQAAANSARPTSGKAGAVVPGKPVRFGQALREAAAAASR